MYPDPVRHLPEDNFPASRPARRLLRAPGSRIWAWLILVAAMISGLVATYRVFVVSSQGQILDHAALASAEVRLQSLHAASVSLLADLPLVVAAVAAAGFLVLTLWRRRWAASIIVALTFAAANLTTQALKIVLERPELANGVPYYTGNSLPSGHVTFATATFAAVFLLVAPRWRAAVGLVGMIFSATVGIATFLDGWHRPADIVAAYLVVGLWTLLGGFIVYRVSADYNVISARARAKYASLSEVLLWLFALIGVGGAVAILFLTGGLAALPAHFEEVTPSLRWFGFGAMLIAGAASLVCALLVSFFRWEAGRDAAREHR